MKTVTLRLDEELHKALKIYSVNKDISIQDLLVKLIKEEIIDDEDEKEYSPMCKYGYCDCIYDREYLKHNYPEWYKELGEPTECPDCHDGDMYDDEDK